MRAAIVNRNSRLMFSKTPKKDSELCFVLDIGCHVTSFHSFLYLPSDKTAPHSRDWCHMGIELFPDITLHTTSERVQFLFNQNFHSSFFCRLRGPLANKDNADSTFPTALCEVTMCPVVAKCQIGNLDSVLCGALIFSAHHDGLCLQCGFRKYIYGCIYLCCFTTRFFPAGKVTVALRSSTASSLFCIFHCWLNMNIQIWALVYKAKRKSSGIRLENEHCRTYISLNRIIYNVTTSYITFNRIIV